MTITAKGDLLHLSGEPPHAGDTAPDFTLLNGSTPVTIALVVRRPLAARLVPHGCGHDAAGPGTIALLRRASAARSIAMATDRDFASARC